MLNMTQARGNSQKAVTAKVKAAQMKWVGSLPINSPQLENISNIWINRVGLCHHMDEV